MAEWDFGFCFPILGFITLFIAFIVTYGLKTFRGGAIPRTRAEMSRMASRKEDTFIMDINHGILGKQVNVPRFESPGYLTVDWAPIGDISGKKFYLPQPLPEFCFDIPPIDLSPACGVGKKLQIILPYEKTTKMLFLKPYITQIHELKIKNAEQKRFFDEMKQILYSTKYSTDALEMLEEVERRRKPRGPSTLLNTEAQTSPQQQQHHHQQQLD